MPDATDDDMVRMLLVIAGEKNILVNSVMSKDVVARLNLEGLSVDIGKLGLVKTNLHKSTFSPDSRNKTLGSSLVALYMAGSKMPPMTRWDMALKQKMQAASSNAWPIQEGVLRKLMTALAQTETQKMLATSLANGITCDAFLKMTVPKQYDVINALWEESTELGAYNVETEAMVDNNNAVDEGDGQLPSSIHPDGPAIGTVRTFKRGPVDRPFTKFGIGFRVEGSGTDEKLKKHIARITTDGMRAQVTIPWLMLENGNDVDGTVISGNVLAPRLNKTAKDLWNESGVCVARSFFGATAFPLRKTGGDNKPENVLLWAVDVEGLVGYDTESYQLGKVDAKGNGPWRAGEKCYKRIHKHRILGYVVVQKLGDACGGWSFKVTDAKWTRAGGTVVARAGSYLDDELAPWVGRTVEVTTNYDFVNNA